MGDRDDQGGEDNQDITEEMDAYYQAKGNSRGGSTILYGLFALVVTLIVAAGLFFGGRAVYRALTGTGDNEISQPAGQGTTESTEDTDGTGQTDNGSGQTPGVSSDEPDDSGTVDDGQTDDIPSTGDDLPRTGSPSGI